MNGREGGRLRKLLFFPGQEGPIRGSAGNPQTDGQAIYPIGTDGELNIRGLSEN